jgi:multiple sugar transport system ATP-binding protein
VKGEPLAGSATLAALQPDGEDETDARSLQLVGAHAPDEVVLTARLSPRTGAKTGEPLRIAVDTARLHFFDPVTEAAIL